ncbi:hypothetical protein BZZ08_01946 [Streptomyces sp. MH60]|nr:hypothetical protein BZZ08_01946 [Streptomyces sp. MH60]
MNPAPSRGPSHGSLPRAVPDPHRCAPVPLPAPAPHPTFRAIRELRSPR